MSGYATARWAENRDWHCDPRLPNPPLWRFVRIAAGLALLIASGAIVEQYWTASKPNTPAPVNTPALVAPEPAPNTRVMSIPGQTARHSGLRGTEPKQEPRIAPPTSTGLTNEVVVTLYESGTPVPTIIHRIRTSPAQYRTTPADLAALRARGVPEDVIQAMLAAQRHK